MKKLLLALILLFRFMSSAYGAVSDDTYVRKDVFEVYMQKLDGITEELKIQSQAINELNKSVAVMSERIDRNF